MCAEANMLIQGSSSRCCRCCNTCWRWGWSDHASSPACLLQRWPSQPFTWLCDRRLREYYASFIVNGAVCQMCSMSVEAINTTAVWLAVNKYIPSAVVVQQDGFRFQSGPLWRKLWLNLPYIQFYSLICLNNGRNDTQLPQSGLACQWFPLWFCLHTCFCVSAAIWLLFCGMWNNLDALCIIREVFQHLVLPVWHGVLSVWRVELCLQKLAPSNACVRTGSEPSPGQQADVVHTEQTRPPDYSFAELSVEPSVALGGRAMWLQGWTLTGSFL